jgi:tetratricopeptide (TPR) repeat protein
MGMSRVCLNMIVKNESRIIERCLAAAAGHVDAYVICDTGSTDATVEVITRYMASRGVPGEVKRAAFVNFEQARNEALEAARGSALEFEYLLLCDADMELVVERAEWREGLSEPAYMVVQRTVGGTLEYENLRLLRRDTPGRYRGVTHEYLDVGRAARPRLGGVWFRDHASGSNRGTKYERDIRLLEQGLKDEPGNARYVFYLGNSYFDLGDSAKALAAYERRATMGGWDEEVFYARYRSGLCLERLGREAEMVQRMLEVHEAHPHRAEPLHALALHYQRQGRHRLAHLFAEAGARLKMPTGGLFVEPEVYAWRCLDIMSVSLYYMGRKAESRDLSKRLLEVVPEGERPRVFRNMQWGENGKG